MNIAGLVAQGKDILKQTDTYAEERTDAPQFEELIAQLTDLRGQSRPRGEKAKSRVKRKYLTGRSYVTRLDTTRMRRPSQLHMI